MNLTIDERTKHRLTGLAVILAVAIIFLPAMLKKSNQRLEENIHVAIELPQKPDTPKIALTEEKDLFEALAVAQASLPAAAPAETARPLASKLASIENFTQKPKPSPALTTAYAVQVAVFNVEKNAEKLVSKLQNQGYKARYHTLTSNQGKPFYKVTVGQLDDRADARQLKEQLIESTQLKGFVIKHEMG